MLSLIISDRISLVRHGRRRRFARSQLLKLHICPV
jgi:hypothetical protein